MRSTNISVSSVHWPVTSLGPGRRVGIWLQGCSIGCAGCMSVHTWKEEDGRLTGVVRLVEVIATVVDDSVSGITVSGGEPFDQADALHELLTRLRASLPGADVLVYSGYDSETLIANHGQTLELCDAVVAGPYVAARMASEHWRGSTNQELMLLTERAENSILPWTLSEETPQLQVAMSGDVMTLIGIPARGDLVRLNASMSQRGLKLTNVGWRR